MLRHATHTAVVFPFFCQAIFPEGTPGSAIDALARLPLWSDGLNYRHGTGQVAAAVLAWHLSIAIARAGVSLDKLYSMLLPVVSHSASIYFCSAVCCRKAERQVAASNR